MKHQIIIPPFPKQLIISRRSAVSGGKGLSLQSGDEISAAVQDVTVQRMENIELNELSDKG